MGDRKSLWPRLHDLVVSITAPGFVQAISTLSMRRTIGKEKNPPSMYEISDFSATNDDIQVFPVNAVGVPLLGVVLKVL